jgi:hypothetical protein
VRWRRSRPDRVRQISGCAREHEHELVVAVQLGLFDRAAQPTRRFAQVSLRFERSRRFERQQKIIRIGRTRAGNLRCPGERLRADLCNHPSRPILSAVAMTSRRGRSRYRARALERAREWPAHDVPPDCNCNANIQTTWKIAAITRRTLVRVGGPATSQAWTAHLPGGRTMYLFVSAVSFARSSRRDRGGGHPSRYGANGRDRSRA